MKRAAINFITIFFSIQLLAQGNDSCKMQVSLLTCTPGTELYSTFGHSALRVIDSIKGTDLIYNYGTFDFDDPKFYSKFVRGKLLYFVSIDEFQNFKAEYEYEKRGITEQVLNLNCDQKKNVLAFLEENAKEENKYYKYDFVRDNCTTRLRDIIEKFADKPFVTRSLTKEAVSYRKLIHIYLDKSGQYWSKLGIDILLGARLDKKLSTNETEYLPDFLLEGFDSTTTAGKNLVSEKKTLLQSTLQPEIPSAFSPLVVFAILFLVVIILSFSKAVMVQTALNIFDKIFFFLLGILGILILFMWFGTDHYTCKNNWNLFWALPTHLFIVAVSFQKNWVKNYFRIIFWITTLLLICWFFLPQQLNNSLFPIVGIIFVRSFFISKKL